MFFNELPNNTSAQTPLILVGFGFTPAQSALFNIAKPLWGMILILVSAFLLYATNLGTGYTCALSYIPCLIGGIIELSSPWSNKVALVVGTQISSFKPSYLLGLNWAGTTTTGHTKKLCLMSSCIVAAAVANMISPEYVPISPTLSLCQNRNHPARLLTMCMADSGNQNTAPATSSLGPS